LTDGARLPRRYNGRASRRFHFPSALPVTCRRARHRPFGIAGQFLPALELHLSGERSS
jgi:hypothetical protein